MMFRLARGEAQAPGHATPKLGLVPCDRRCKYVIAIEKGDVDVGEGEVFR
jgi:hypothetical protein